MTTWYFLGNPYLDPGTGGGEAPPPPPPEDPSAPGPNAGPRDAEPPPEPQYGPTPGPYEPPTVTVYVYEWRARWGNTCSACAALDGLRWEDDDGPHPPLHVNCRCRRVLVRTYERATAAPPEWRPIDPPRRLP